MGESIKRMLGLSDGGKRVYRFVSGDVSKEDYEYCQTLDALLFGEGGYVETLGPTWDLVMDGRFSKIEDAFIVNRRAVFGGDAIAGKQYISSDGQFTSTIADLEEYSQILGEGRYFCYILTHPNRACPVRNWYLRIFSPSETRTNVPVASPELKCTCEDTYLDPHGVKYWSDEDTWGLIKQECPNYFSKEGSPNGIARRLFDLFRADLLGLIADYALTPMSDVFVQLDTGDVYRQEEGLSPYDAAPHVFLEVDILEKALTQRAVLRATAAKILRQINFHKTLKDELGDDFILTEYERDQLLRLVYSPSVQSSDNLTVSGVSVNPDANWYLFLSVVSKNVLQFIQGIKATGLSAEEREKQQIQEAKTKAQSTLSQLLSGEIQPINQYSEPEADVQLDLHAAVMEAVLNNPLKQELFMLWVEAERLSGHENEDNELRMKMSRMYSVLTPIFTDPDFPLDEGAYLGYMEIASELGLFSHTTTNVEEEFHG